MGKGRLEAFSDGVIAILITIMVLELKAPKSLDSHVVHELISTFLSYALSFIYLGIYWNNHHHLFQVVDRVSGAVLWANMNLLFWLSLIPFATSWMGNSHFDTLPVFCYGLSLLFPAIAYYILTRVLLRCHHQDSHLAHALGNDFKGKISIVLYLTALPLAYVHPWISCGIYCLVAVIWFVPDYRVERVIQAHREGKHAGDHVPHS